MERFHRQVLIPKSFSEVDGVGYLGGDSLNELISVEQKTTELSLARNGRPNNSIVFPEVNPHTIGQLLFMLELQTVLAGGLYRVNPLDQPGVEEGKQFAYGLMGRGGFDHKLKESEARPKKLAKYVVR